MSSPKRNWSESETLAGGIRPESETLVGGVTAVGAPDSSSAAPLTIASRRSDATATATLPPGTILGERYEILELLGEGGMGAVYKTNDRELDRLVALKTVRSELAANPEILQRFKQEVLLASRITHRNVVRLYDLGEAAGLKFITMEYVEGVDLRSLLLQKGKLLPAEAVETIRQVCMALEAAHSQGVIHRDLKPQNIMQESQGGRIVVMDFGLARSLAFDGMTQTGALVGTMEYMSPEQAMSGKVDQRSDVFAVGLILYELLTGKMPYKAESALASLLKRSQERAVPASEIDATVPRALSEVVSKSLERDPAKRYQSASELLADLDRHVAVVPARISVRPWLPRRKRTWAAAALILAAALGVGAGVALHYGLLPQRPAAQDTAGPVLSVAFVPLRNASGDPNMEWFGSSVAEMLGTDIGHSPQLRTVSSDALHQILQDLRIGPEARLDRATLRRLAGFTNANVIVWGEYVKLGNQLRLDLTIEDLKNDRRIPIKAEAASENELAGMVDRIAESVRNSLSLSSDAVKQLQASAFKPSTTSIAALRDYNQGLDYLRHGKNLEAEKAFEAAAKDDPQFALACSQLGQAYANLGYGDKAEEFAQKAVELAEKLPEQERYRILATKARVSNDNQKAIEYYGNLAKVSPNDSDIQLTLARLYRNVGAYDTARDYLLKLVAHAPNDTEALVALAEVEGERRNPQGALDYLNRALSLAVQLDNDELRARVLYETGYTYKLLNKPAEALNNYQESLALRQRLGQKAGTAQVLAEIADIQYSQGKPELAIRTYNQAVQLQREVGDKTYLSHTLLNLGSLYSERGQYDEGLKDFKESLQLQRELHNEDYEALCLNNIGNVYLSTGRYDDALTYYQQALDLMQKLKNQGQVPSVLFNLGDTDTRLGQYEQAINNYLRGLELARNAGDKQLAAVGGFSLGKAFAAQGRYGAALSAQEEAVKNYRELNDRTSSMAQALGGYGQALALAGRTAEARKVLEEELALARDIKSDINVAQALQLQGESLIYDGDLKTARSSLQQALQAATRSKDPETLLTIKTSLAQVAVAEGHSPEVLPELRKLAQEAETRGLKDVSVLCGLSLAQAMLNAKDYRGAAEEADRVRRLSDKMGFRLAGAKARYLQADILRVSGKASDAASLNQQARQIVEDISKESNAASLLKRADLQPILSGN